MKICVIASLFAPYERGGAEVVANTVVSLLKETGHEVCVITTCPFSGLRFLWPRRELVDGVRVFRFFPLNIFWVGHIASKNWALRLFWHVVDTWNFHTFMVVRALLQREKPDIVFTHNLKGLGYTVPWAVKSLKYPLVHTVHDVQLFTPSGLILFGKKETFEHNNPVTKLYRFCTRWLFSMCDTVIFPSSFLKKFYEQHGFFQRSRRVVLSNPIKQVLPRPVQRSSFLTRNKRLGNSIKSSLGGIPAPVMDTGLTPAGIQKDRTIGLLYIGQIEQHKGIFLLVEALQEMQEKDFSLHIAGQGRGKEKLLAQIHGDQRFLYHGFLAREALHNLILEMDLLIFPSICYENLPSVIIESLRCGVPVLASNLGGVPEVIKDGYNGLLFEPGNITSLTKKISWCIENISTLKSWKQMCIRSISSFDVEHYRKQLFHLMEEQK